MLPLSPLTHSASDHAPDGAPHENLPLPMICRSLKAGQAVITRDRPVLKDHEPLVIRYSRLTTVYDKG